MAMVSGVEQLNRNQLVPPSRKFGRFFDFIGKYAVDLAINLPFKKPVKGRRQLHKTVQEEVKERVHIQSCKDKQKLPTVFSEKEIQTHMQEMQQEINGVNHKVGTSSGKMELLSSNKLPSEPPKEKDFPMPNKRRIFIRSRL